MPFKKEKAGSTQAAMGALGRQHQGANMSSFDELDDYKEVVLGSSCIYI
jgi:hypothetical protein